MQNQKSTKRVFNLHRNQVARACLTMVMVATAPAAFAGAGWGLSNNEAGAEVVKKTYYAHSPSGQRVNAVPAAQVPVGYPTTNGANDGATGFTGKALRKFVDKLPGVGESPNTLSDDAAASKYIPQAVATKWRKPEGTSSTTATYAGDDYYEIAVVQYQEKLHSDLKPSTLRGYVQIDHEASNGRTALPGSKQVALYYPDGTRIQINGTDANGKLTGSKVDAVAVDKPHYLGPAIVATKGVATRLKFHNLLPVGRYDEAKGRQGDLFIPVDETLAGAGVGPDGVIRYTQNRAQIHLHGGDTPWISDGTPHQWIAPAGEKPLITAEMATKGSSTLPVDTYLRGPSAQNVPDMNLPGDGAVTYYFPNEQSARLMWYHDHTYGLTRLNVYVGQAAPYVLTDAKQEAALAAGVDGFPSDVIRLVIQDKTFVPDDIALQDARWNGVTTKKADGSYEDKPMSGAAIWGGPGDLWYPHVYEVNQDPSNGLDGTNPVGRWDWGPYFWPVFPAYYNLPTGAVGDVTITPEAWMDTPLVNGVAYPTLTVDPKPQRFQILNGANDRFWNLSFFVADGTISAVHVANGGAGYNPATTTVTISSNVGSGAVAEPVIVGGVITAVKVTNPGAGYSSIAAPITVQVVDASNPANTSAVVSALDNTEVKMVPAAPIETSGLPACDVDGNSGMDKAYPYAPVCWPSNWPTDGRDGGVPDPRAAGPKFYQIGNEGGLLPHVAEIAAAPMQYEYNRRSITVLNTFQHGLFLGNAERADVLVDFSPYAGKTLIMYSDAPAPVPAFDPRNDHWTGKPDESTVGSVETPLAGYGPNTRTVMQIKVADKPAGTALGLQQLKDKLPVVYGNAEYGQPAPVVAQSQYASAFGTDWSDAPDMVTGTKAFATIFTGSLQEPTFRFNSGSPNAGFDKIILQSGGSGYLKPPLPVLGAPDSTDARVSKVQATAATTLRVEKVNVTNTGSGYKFVPVVSIVSRSAGSGASALARMLVTKVNMGNLGSGYTTAPAVTFSAPDTPGLKDAATATGHAVVVNGQVTEIVIDSAGKGYHLPPLVAIDPPVNGTRATVASTEMGIASIDLVSNDPNHPEFAGGAGYDDLTRVSVTLTAPSVGNNPATATVTGSVSDITVVNAGSGYTTLPSVTIPQAIDANGNTINTSVAATAVASKNGGSILVKNKAIQELFDPTYGRMNATLGIEIPFTSALTQTTIPLGYVDPATEEFSDGETQIWKITHNGVDAHPVHFHLLNVQLINRVGWDGTIKKPMDNEYGWKETIRMNPLEDILVAVRAKKPKLPGFGVPNSNRLRDPSQPEGVPTGFTQIDVKTGLPALVTNEREDYGWEYVWHCHILGHEENDFMRPVKFNAGEVIPATPTSVSLNRVAGVDTLTWLDNSQTEYEQELRILTLAKDGVTYVDSPATPTGIKYLANAKSAIITRVPNAVGYGVKAIGANGSSTGWYLNTGVGRPGYQSANMTSGSTARFSWRDLSNNETSFIPQLSSDGGLTWSAVNPNQPEVPGSQPASATGGTFFVDANNLLPEVTYTFRVMAKYALNATYFSTGGASANVSTSYIPPKAPVAPIATLLAAPGSAKFAWTDNSGDENAFRPEISADGGATWTPVDPAQPLIPTISVGGRNYQMSVTATGLAHGVTYKFRVYSVRTGFGESKTAATADLLFP